MKKSLASQASAGQAHLNLIPMWLTFSLCIFYVPQMGFPDKKGCYQRPCDTLHKDRVVPKWSWAAVTVLSVVLPSSEFSRPEIATPHFRIFDVSCWQVLNADRSRVMRVILCWTIRPPYGPICLQAKEAALIQGFFGKSGKPNGCFKDSVENNSGVARPMEVITWSFTG